ncbi:MAG: hypothetical protein E6K45_11065 [Gammaproteobacteria bacterium]|nr:MAG: hypothetical protein E6K45_11065 [Gammaproteobacteria bacterium]TLY86058.1 MAG: hypothetical protein E6K37_06905 [Gammaproteobacteria bacterium]TLY99804.1 MAG: hypothetical protein E6K33_10505 [Gammaproteobacteria bacterium]TLZ07957.1 MAG: hypothetical protein E6K39_07015 [Gammaproteobacteria bacterium]TLZ08602.1 MAG: hypothetical protein E6K28_08985 [Gammaproteobacteria bacterium]
MDLDAGEVGRPLEPVAGERLARGKLCLERVYLVGRNVDQLDLRIERRVERRQETDVSKTQGKRRRRQGQQQCQRPV